MDGTGVAVPLVVVGLLLVAPWLYLAVRYPERRVRFLLATSTGVLLVGLGLWNGRAWWLAVPVFLVPVARLAYAIVLSRRERAGQAERRSLPS